MFSSRFKILNRGFHVKKSLWFYRQFLFYHRSNHDLYILIKFKQKSDLELLVIYEVFLIFIILEEIKTISCKVIQDLQSINIIIIIINIIKYFIYL